MPAELCKALLLIECAKAGVITQASTRRAERVGPGRFFLDLTASQPTEYLPDNTDPILIVAAITGFDVCENDLSSATVNVEAPVQIAKASLAAKRRVIFISSSSVFGGDLPLCSEYEEVMPLATYSKQKAEAERQLGALPGWPAGGSIVRLTKVLSPSTSPIPAWREALSRGEPISPFSDIFFAPISPQFAARSLIKIALSPHCGNYHLSGLADLTYEELARRYVEAHNFSDALVVSTTAVQAGVNLFFNRRYCALGMARTHRLLNIAPQTISSVVADLLQSEAGKKSTAIRFRPMCDKLNRSGFLCQ